MGAILRPCDQRKWLTKPAIVINICNMEKLKLSERGGSTFTNLMSNRDFLQTVVSFLGGFRANGARRVVINFSGERERQLADGFVLK
jgi:hypothetical protein